MSRDISELEGSAHCPSRKTYRAFIIQGYLSIYLPICLSIYLSIYLKSPSFAFFWRIVTMKNRFQNKTCLCPSFIFPSVLHLTYWHTADQQQAPARVLCVDGCCRFKVDDLHVGVCGNELEEASRRRSKSCDRANRLRSLFFPQCVVVSLSLMQNPCTVISVPSQIFIDHDSHVPGWSSLSERRLSCLSSPFISPLSCYCSLDKMRKQASSNPRNN